MYKSLFLVISFTLFIFTSCEKIEVIPPPDDDGTSGKTGTGDSRARGMIFVQCDTASLFMDSEDAIDYYVTNTPEEIFKNTEFGKPLESNTNKINVVDIPLLNSNDFIKLEPPTGNLELSTPLSAFGTTASTDWNLDSEWWNLDPQEKDYNYDPNNLIVKELYISQDETWTSDNQYLLRGQVFVKSGVTLTIEPGTIIFGEKATGINSGVLCFNRGTRIEANGTPEQPIIFTTTIAPDQRTRGQWGGTVFCGKAPNNKSDDVLLEEIQSHDENNAEEDGHYGGNVTNDNSGSFSYWRIEFAGISISPGNEINSLTLGSVGTETNIHHIIITYAGDDGIEWFGGGVDAHHIGIYNSLDDDLDMDQGYNGNIQYGYVIRNPYAADESGAADFEVGSSKSTGSQPRTTANVSNFTTVGPIYQLDGTELIWDPKYQGGMYSKQDAAVNMINSIIVGAPVGVQNE